MKILAGIVKLVIVLGASIYLASRAATQTLKVEKLEKELHDHISEKKEERPREANA